VRQLAQTLAREMSEKGVHVVHTIANGSIADEDGEDQKTGKKMSADVRNFEIIGGDCNGRSSVI
jgi:hypothetical protein